MVHELRIAGWLALNRSPEACDVLRAAGCDLAAATYAEDVAREIAAAEARGARVILAIVSSRGGGALAALAMYDALRGFSDRGGTVIAYVAPPYAGSSAPLVAMAADRVVLDPAARFLLHSAMGPGDAGERANAFMAEALACLTAAPLATLRHACSVGGFDEAGAMRVMAVNAGDALELGFAEALGTEGGARDLAESVAALGARLPPPPYRRHAAAARVVRPSLAPVLASIVSDKIAANAITAGKIAAGSITADKIAAGQLKTSNYAEDANGYATAGAKLDHQGTALKVAPGNLQIGMRSATAYPPVKVAARVDVRNRTFITQSGCAYVDEQFTGVEWYLRIGFSFPDMRLPIFAVTISDAYNYPRMRLQDFTDGASPPNTLQLGIFIYSGDNICRRPSTEILAGTTLHVLGTKGAWD